MKYKIYKDSMTGKDCGVIRDNGDDSFTSFLFNPDNTDYQNFKAQINADQAQLEDADGVLMSPEAAKAYVAKLP